MNKSFGLYLVLVGLFSSSCKMNDRMNLNQEDGGSLAGFNRPSARVFTSSELDIGRRICSNLKKKREFFETLSNEKERFRFKGELRNCDNETYNTNIFDAAISNANSTDLEYVAQRQSYFKDVVTDVNGILKDMCSALNTADNVSNTAVSGNFKYSFNFLIADNYDRYEIYKSQKGKDNSYQLLNIEVISVIGQKIQAPTKFFGVEKERTRYTVCDGKRYSTMKQSWIEAITPF